MTLKPFLDDLGKNGIELWTEEGKLKYRAPKGGITKDLLSELAENKQEIISIIEDQNINSQYPTAIVPQPEKRYEPFPLTEVQQAYWIGRKDIYELGNVSTYIYSEIEGNSIDLERLNKAWNIMIKKHDMLRVVFRTSGFQEVLQNVPDYCFKKYELSGADDTNINFKLKEVRQEMSHQVIAADEWPIFDIRAAILPHKKIRLCLGFDFLIADAWSQAKLMEDWIETYNNPFKSQSQYELSFRDYVLYERKMKNSGVYQKSKKYWMDRIDNFCPGPSLPLAVDPILIKKPQFIRYEFTLSKDDWLKLKRKSAFEKLTPTCVLLSAFVHILKKWSKNPVFTINMTLFNRPPLHPEIDEIVGEFTVLNMLNIDFSTQGSFLEKSIEIQDTLMKDLDHRHYSGVEVIRELIRRKEDFKSGSIPVVFTSALGFGSGSSDETSNLSKLGKVVYTITQTPQIWLDHQVYEDDGSLRFNWDVVKGLFPDKLIEEMFQAYCDILVDLSIHAESWDSDRLIPLPVNQMEIRNKINDTYKKIEEQTLHGLFASAVEAYPDNYAVISSDSNISYKDLDNYARYVAVHLINLNVKPGSRVAVLMEKGWEQVAAVLGILYSGATYVPIAMDIPYQRLEHIINDAGVTIVFTTSKVKDEIKFSERITSLCFEEISISKSPVLIPDFSKNHDDIAYLIYTSGSTGEPKGVVIDHKGAVNTILDINRRFSIDSQDRVLALSDLNFDLSVYDLFGILATGGSIVFPVPEKLRDPEHWIELITEFNITIWNSVPALMKVIVNCTNDNGLSFENNIRLVLLSGDWISSKLPDQVQKLFQHSQIISLGGATEASIWSILYPIKDIDPEWKSIPYGTPMDNQRFYVFDEFMNNCPDWVIGQLYIGGLGIAKGYWQDDEKTKSSFIVHPRTGESIYRTGDIGRYLPDGNIEFFGRADFQVKIRGYRIELQEIETILRNHPAVSDAVVLAFGDPRDYKGLVGYVVLNHEKESLLFETLNADTGDVKEKWTNLISSGNKKIQELSDNEETFRNAMIAFFQDMDQLFEFILCVTFRKLGAYLVPHEKYTVDSLIKKTGINIRYKKWLYRGLKVLEKQNFLKHSNGFFENHLPLPEQSIDELLRKSGVKAQKNIGYDEKEIDLISESIKNLPDILREDKHSVEIYTSGEMPALSLKTFEFCNSVVRELIKSLVKSLSPNKALRILEVGAGLGTMTQHVLPILPSENITYYFTDVSNYFLQQAEKNFEAYPFINYGLLDLDLKPQNQGYGSHSFDLVIASSVLHATINIKQALQNIRSMLAPGGILLMVEETKFHDFFDLSMGIQQGFDSFEDYDLRKTHPFLSINEWKRILKSEKFEKTTIFNNPGSIADFLGFNVIVTSAPLSVKKFKSEDLNFFLRSKLPEYMIPSFIDVIDKLPLTSSGKVDRKALSTDIHVVAGVERRLVAPRTPTESSLAEIWRQILKIDQIGVYDSFFEIGGDSLLAIQLIPLIRNAFKVELPVQGLFEAPTISQLANLIDKDNNLSQWSPLVVIQPKGSLRPFFCVHASDGFVFNYKKLSNLMGTDQPFYGIQSRGIDGKLEQYTQLEMISAHYIDSIRSVQEDGPYVIGGWSMGAVVAFDMAQKLHDDGQRVGLLVLIDPPIPKDWQVIYEKVRNDLFGMMSVFVQDPYMALKFAGLSHDEFQQESPEQQLTLFYDGAHFSGQLPFEMSFEQFKVLIRVLKVNLGAMCQYVPRGYSGSPVVVIKADEQHQLIPTSGTDNFAFWEKLIESELMQRQVSGNHWSMMLEDVNLRILAKELRLILNERNY